MAEKRYGFIRCSTDKQNEARQLKALRDFGIPDEDIIIEKESGKIRGAEREQYSVLRKLLREGDSLVVDAIDRLGRRKSDIKSEVEYLRSKKVRLIVLSLPTTAIDPGQGQEWVLDMVTNLLIEVYASIAEQELVEKERRTRAGIEIAKSEGKYKGRKPIEYDVRQIEQCYSRWKSGVIKTPEFRKLLGLKPNTFYRAIEKYEKTCDQGQKARRTELPQAAEGRSA